MLIVEDDPLMRATTEALVAHLGHRPIAAANGLDAVALYRSSGIGIDVVLLDVVMPLMNGEQVFDELMAFDPECRIVLATGGGLGAKFDDPEAVGLAGVLSKPFGIAELAAVLGGLTS